VRQPNGGVTLSNSVIQIDIDIKGDMTKFGYLQQGITDEIEENFYFYKTNYNTRSGHYIFNPRHQKEPLSLSNTAIYMFEGSALQIVQVYKSSTNYQLLKTYIVNSHGCPNLMKQLNVEIQFFQSAQTIEVLYSLTRKPKSIESSFKAYVDDSMKLVERPIYNTSVSTKRTNNFELNGLFTYPCVHGGVLRETYKDSALRNLESFFGWANSNPIGCVMSGNNQVEFMISRTIGNNDYKGVNENLYDKRVVSTGFQFYIDKSVPGVLFHKVRANTKLNEPYAVFTNKITRDLIPTISKSSNLLADIMRMQNYGNQLSSEFGEVDVVDIKLMRHTILTSYSDYELAIVLRNRYNGYVEINRETSHNGEGMFKNKYIDVLKNTEDSNFRNKCDRNKQILAGDRYELVTLESEIDKHQIKPANFHGLEPYELAEFRIVASATLEALDIKKKQIDDSISHGTRVLG